MLISQVCLSTGCLYRGSTVSRLGHGFGETGFYRLTALDVLLKLNLAVSVHTQLFF